MELTSGSPLLRMKDSNRSKEQPGTGKKWVGCALIRTVRRGIRMTEKFLHEQDDLNALNINETDPTGKNIFHLCVQREELLEFLLGTFKHHPRFNEALYMEDTSGNTPAHIAALHNEKKSIQMLVTTDKKLFHVRSKLTGKSLIHCAVESGSVHTVQYIVEEKPDTVFDKDIISRTPIHYAAASKDSSILEFVISHGVDITETDDSGCTALHLATENGSLSNVKLLLTHDVELVNLVNKSDQTALHIACKNGHGIIVSMLLESGGNPLHRDENGHTALECGMKYQQYEATNQLLLSDQWRELVNEFEGGFRKCFVSLVANMPLSAKILLDRCIQYSDMDPLSEEYSVTYDFFLLDCSGNNPPKFEGLSAMLENQREECVMHNVSRKFLSVKWRQKGYKLYFTNLMIYLTFHVLFNAYIMLVRGAVTRESLEGSKNENSTIVTSGDSDYPKPDARPHETGPIVATTIIVTFTLLNLVKELLQVFDRERAEKKNKQSDALLDQLLHSISKSSTLPDVSQNSDNDDSEGELPQSVVSQRRDDDDNDDECVVETDVNRVK